MKKIIISGGGTGGHIFPALSIAAEIRKKDPAASILFVGARGRMEMDKVPAAGFPIIGLPVEGFRRSLSPRNLLVLFKLVQSMFRASQIIREFKPDVAIGVGGYASGPLLRVAARMKIPVFIQEQNSFAGLTNRLLAGKALRIYVAYPGMEKYFPASKILLTGNPVREDLLATTADRTAACSHFGLLPGKPVVLVLGGSQGAGTINRCILDNIDLIERKDIQFYWQTGRLYYEEVRKRLVPMNVKNIRYVDFINRMDLAYRMADVVVSRAGAGTISELCLVGKPMVLVPSPNVAEDHQTSNAMALVERNAALMVSDREAPGQLIPQIIRLLEDHRQRETLAENCRKMALPHSSSLIVEDIYRMVP